MIRQANLNKDKKNIPPKEEDSKDIEKEEGSKLKENKGKYPADFFTGS